jgi:hypothetical protein
MEASPADDYTIRGATTQPCPNQSHVFRSVRALLSADRPFPNESVQRSIDTRAVLSIISPLAEYYYLCPYTNRRYGTKYESR